MLLPIQRPAPIDHFLALLTPGTIIREVGVKTPLRVRIPVYVALCTSMARFTDLPEELVSNVAQRLGSDDLFSLRLTCRALSERCFHDFATGYFSERCVMLTSESLRVLISISKHPQLKKYVHGVFILTALFSAEAFDACDSYQPTTSQSKAYRFLIGDQKQMKKSKFDVAALGSSFKGLPSLSTVGIVDALRYANASTNCWGINKAIRQTGMYSRV